MFIFGSRDINVVYTETKKKLTVVKTLKRTDLINGSEAKYIQLYFVENRQLKKYK